MLKSYADGFSVFCFYVISGFFLLKFLYEIYIDNGRDAGAFSTFRNILYTLAGFDYTEKL